MECRCQRDRNADGKLYYSVKTTGVYCRPSCAPRLARRENVEFHASCKEAERAGFRPCKRCRPNGSRPAEPSTTILFAAGECSLGSILVAASERGVCAVLLGNDTDALIKNVRDRFPKAHLIRAAGDFGRLVSQIINFIEAPESGINFPLDLRGTAFQRRVWQALREIPVGATASYSEIAERIGSPQAVRAVAQACASNTIAVAIPCHRILRADDDISGYRWGVERKRALLEREVAA
jgi:AraC family transcriptional regulator, regulatory protein of adaptative response / methylated-DNA-[protein]-cysteine methyltransferase